MPQQIDFILKNINEFVEADDDDDEEGEEEAEAEEKPDGEEEEAGDLGEAEENDEDDDEKKKKLTKETIKISFVEQPVVLTKEEARKGLNTVGRTLDGVSFAYINIDVIGRRLTDVSVIKKMKWVLHINVSENMLTSEALGALSPMTTFSLKADNNRVKTLNFPLINHLKILSLKSNAIETTIGLEGSSLTYLHLDNNKIKSLILDALAVPKLRCLTVANNMIHSIKDLQVPSLQDLYLGGNQIKKLDGLEQFSELRVLHLRGNQIKKLKGFTPRMTKLNYINLRSNKIENIKEMKRLSSLKYLRTLVSKNNPFDEGDEDDEGGEEEGGNRLQILARVPRLTRLDKVLVTEDERMEAKELKKSLDEEDEDESEESEDEEDVGEEGAEEEGEDDNEEDDE